MFELLVIFPVNKKMHILQVQASSTDIIGLISTQWNTFGRLDSHDKEHKIKEYHLKQWQQLSAHLGEQGALKLCLAAWQLWMAQNIIKMLNVAFFL